MCGIVGAVAKREVTGILCEGLQRLEYRGYDSAGIAVISSLDSTLQRLRKVGKVKELIGAIRENRPTGSTGIAHTRWATHGKPTEKNAHPHMSGDRVALIHNGIIENHVALRLELQADGYQFHSETDTEVVVHLIDREIQACGDLLGGLKKAVQQLTGAFALGVLHRDYPDRIVAARVGSPLIIGVGIGENFIASDTQALRPVTDRFS